MKRKLLCAVLLGLVFLTGCKKDSSDVDTVSSVKTDDAVLISVLEKYPKVDFASEDEIETIYISDQAAEWKKDFDTSDYENYDENYEEFCELMDEFMETELEAGRITSYTKNDYAYLVTFESGEMTGYTIPSPEGCLAGDGGGINTIVTIWPGIEDFTAKNACGAKEAMGHVAANYEVNMQSSYEFGFYSEPENILEPWLNIEKGDIIIFESHGSYVSPDYKKYGDYRLVDGPSLCIGQKICKQDLLDYLNTNGLGECLSGMIMYDEKTRNGKIYGDVYLPWGFFDIYYEPGDLEGTVFYLGSCASMGDDKLASTLCNLGAEVVIGWDGKSYSHYERDACEHLFKLLAEGENVTNAISLTYDEYYWDYHASVHGGSRLIHGAWAEMCCYPVGSTFTLDELYGSDEPQNSGETVDIESQNPDIIEEKPVNQTDNGTTKTEEFVFAYDGTDLTNMRAENIATLSISYTDAYFWSGSHGKTPDHVYNAMNIMDYNNGPDSVGNTDMEWKQHREEFEVDGNVVPLWFYEGEREYTEDIKWLTDGASDWNDNTTDEMSWGKYNALPQEVKDILNPVLTELYETYFLSDAELRSKAHAVPEEGSYTTDSLGRPLEGYDHGVVYYFENDKVIRLEDRVKDISWMLILPNEQNAETPWENEYYVGVQREDGSVEYYKFVIGAAVLNQYMQVNYYTGPVAGTYAAAYEFYDEVCHGMSVAVAVYKMVPQ